jgi:membrane protein DedA with SNARE-associated domain
MESLLSQLIDFLMPMGNHLIYFFLFIAALFENLFPPVPGDTITAFGAFLVGTGRLDFFLVYFVTTAGSTAGFIILFLLGGFLEREFFVKKDYSFFPAEKIESAEKWFRKYGYFIVFLNRFMPGLRSVISIGAGICGLKVLPVFFLSLASAMVWNLIWIYAGFAIGDNWEEAQAGISRLLSHYNYTVGTVIVIIILFITFKYFRKKSAS